MTRKKIVRLGLEFLILYLVLVGVLFISGQSERRRDYQVMAPMRDMQSCLDDYVAENRGCFPESQAELEAKSFLTKETVGDETIYRIRVTPDIWRKIEFDKFRIRYGAKPGDFFVKDEKLYDGQFGLPALLFDAPHIDVGDNTRRNALQTISVCLYEEMCRQGGSHRL